MSDEYNPYELYADELTVDDRPELLHLNCGDEPWSRATAEWMLGSDVWESIEKHNTQVWLYRNGKGVIVGFGYTRGSGSWSNRPLEGATCFS